MGNSMGDVEDFIFVGFNSRVAALHRDTGEIMWEWKSPKGACAYVAVLLDRDRIIASVHGYTYGLDAFTGEELWRNELPGFGMGYPTIASALGSSGNGGPAVALTSEQNSG